MALKIKKVLDTIKYFANHNFSSNELVLDQVHLIYEQTLSRNSVNDPLTI